MTHLPYTYCCTYERNVQCRPGLTHEITIVRGQGRKGVYAEDRSIYVLG